MSRRCHAQERVRAHDGADFLEHAPPQVLRLSRQADALIVGEAQPTRAELPAEDAVLGLEIVDDLALLLVDPACERENEESERVRQRRREAQGSRSAEERPHDRINGHYGITVAPNRARRGKPRLQPRSCLRITAPAPDPRAAMLAAVLAGESPADGSCPAAIVVILGDEKGDQLVGSPGVNVSVGWERIPVGSAKGGKQVDRPQRERTEVAPKLLAHVKRISGGVGSAEQLGSCEGQRRRSRSWAYAAGELPGVGGGWHVDTERAAKARNHSRVAEAMAQRRHRV